MGILDLHGLKLEHFPNLEAALASADKLIAHQREEIDDITVRHPDIILGDPMLDQFWYAKHAGIMGMMVGGVVGGRDGWVKGRG